MQYSSFIGDHIPCRYKSLIEDSALKQLLFASDERAKVKPEFIAEFRNRVIMPKDKSKTCLEGEMKGSSNKRRQQGEDEGSNRSLALQEVLSLLTKGGKFTRKFRGWKLCSLVHDKPILYGLPDDPKARLRRSNSLYISAYDDFPQLISKSAKLTNLHSPSSAVSARLSASNLHQQGQRSALKVRSCHAAETENAASLRMPFQLKGPIRPSSSGTVSGRQEDVVRSVSLSEQRAVMDELNDLMQTKDPNNYTANYRGGYTYRKLHDQRPSSSSTPVVNAMSVSTPVTKATSRCSSSPLTHPLAKACLGRIEILPVGNAQKSVSTPAGRSTPTIPKATPTTTRSTPTYTSIAKPREKFNQGGQSDSGIKDQEFDQKIPTRWPTNQRLHDLSDPQSVINQTPPTEVALLYRVTPGIQALSSPSIPSNTNGKFGGKSKDCPYPFELHISAASCPVRSTAKKAAKFNI